MLGMGLPKAHLNRPMQYSTSGHSQYHFTVASSKCNKWLEETDRLSFKSLGILFVSPMYTLNFYIMFLDVSTGVFKKEAISIGSHVCLSVYTHKKSLNHSKPHCSTMRKHLSLCSSFPRYNSC